MKLAKIWWFMRQVLKDPNAKNYTDEALRISDDYDHQEMYQLSDAARQAGAKAKRIEEQKHAMPRRGRRRRSRGAVASLSLVMAGLVPAIHAEMPPEPGPGFALIQAKEILITRQRQPVLASGKASGRSSAQRMRGGGSWSRDRIGD